MFKFLNPDSNKDMVFQCLFLFAFFSFARKSNLVPNNDSDFSNPKFLLRKDIELKNDRLIITMRLSKTNQFGQRILQIPLMPIEGSVLCPVKAYQNMCALVPANPPDPLFSLPKHRCITYYAFQKKLKHLISKIGMNPTNYSTHSLRRGGTTFSFKSNVPTVLIKAHGDWKSDCYQKYVSLSLDDKLLVASCMKERILSQCYD